MDRKRATDKRRVHVASREYRAHRASVTEFNNNRCIYLWSCVTHRLYLWIPVPVHTGLYDTVCNSCHQRVAPTPSPSWRSGICIYSLQPVGILSKVSSRLPIWLIEQCALLDPPFNAHWWLIKLLCFYATVDLDGCVQRAICMYG